MSFTALSTREFKAASEDMKAEVSRVREIFGRLLYALDDYPNGQAKLKKILKARPDLVEQAGTTNALSR